MSAFTTYKKLPEDESEGPVDEHPLIRDGYISSRKRTIWNTLLVLLLLIVSNTITWLASTTSKMKSDEGHMAISPNLIKDPPTPFAGLQKTITTPMHGHDPYTDRNDTFRDELWQAINIDEGMIALPDDIAREKGLPLAQRFPWDHTKGVYLLHGHHNLHCVRSIYIALMEYKNNLPQTRNFRHIIHCLDSLRQDVICNADDTPRVTTNDSIPETGHGQYRQCRSWEELSAWAKQYPACYRYINETQTPQEFPQIQRFVWCPEGSPYRAEVEKVFEVDYTA